MSKSDNPHNGAVFQEQVKKRFEEYYHRTFVLEKKIAIGNPPKDYKFDTVDENETIIIECKRYTWMETGNGKCAE